MSGFRTVIVGTDGSASSMRAVERAGEVAAHDNARLIRRWPHIPRMNDNQVRWRPLDSVPDTRR